MLKNKGNKIILLGHDAFAAGAQILLLNIGKNLINHLKCQIHFILLSEGQMLDKYESIASTLVCKNLQAIDFKTLREQGFEAVLSNTVVTGLAAGLFRDNGFYVCSLIHELPELIINSNLIENYETICLKSNIVIYPADYVKLKDESRLGPAKGRTIVYPQGLFKKIVYPPDSYKTVRQNLGLQQTDHIVLGMGYGYHRKGIDIFLKVADQVSQCNKTIHFLWVGEIIHNYLQKIKNSKAKNLHIVSFKEDVMPYYAAANLFFLSSREDPFPCVVLEALAVGLPIVAFESAGGYVSLFDNAKIGALVPYLDTKKACETINEILFDDNQHTLEAKDFRKKTIKEKHNFDDYCATLCNLLIMKE